MSGPSYKPIKPQTNTIFRGDNLAIMRALPSDFVDLIYIDPPFFTQQNYKNIWGDKESVLDFKDNFFEGFEDTKDFFERHIQSDAKGLKAYLEWMRARLVETHRILKPTGSFYLHLDYHAIHYIKVILDEIFGYKNFKNEIIWRRKQESGPVYTKFSNNHDTILFYTKSDEYFFEKQYTFMDKEELKATTYRHKDENGRYFCKGPTDNPAYRPNLIFNFKGYNTPQNGWRWSKEKMNQFDKEGRLWYPDSKEGRIQLKLFLDEHKGQPVNNIWDDIECVRPNSKECTKWPTQKPMALLERIIKASSKEGDLVFDCFAGCGTAMHVAHTLKRKWIGIDISPTAIKVNGDRLTESKAKVSIIDENDLPVILDEKGPRQQSKEKVA